MTQPITQPNYGEYRWFASAIGEYMGWGADWNMWDHEQENVADDLIESGCMAFYFPQPVDLMPSGHNWSFLRPRKKLATASGQDRYELPVDFERFDGKITYEPGDEQDYPPIDITSEQRIRQLAYRTNYNSYPVYAAEVPKINDGSETQRFDVVFHPTPDSTYRLEFAYVAVPKKLTDDYPVPLGGRMVAEALKAMIIAEAELHKDGKQGPRARIARDKLTTAVAHDMKRMAEVIGYNADRSTMSRNSMHRDIRKVRDFLFSNVTYE